MYRQRANIILGKQTICTYTVLEDIKYMKTGEKLFDSISFFPFRAMIRIKFNLMLLILTFSHFSLLCFQDQMTMFDKKSVVSQRQSLVLCLTENGLKVYYMLNRNFCIINSKLVINVILPIRNYSSKKINIGKSSNNFKRISTKIKYQSHTIIPNQLLTLFP